VILDQPPHPAPARLFVRHGQKDDGAAKPDAFFEERFERKQEHDAKAFGV